MRGRIPVLFGLVLLAATAAQAQFEYTTNGGDITITAYTGSGGAVVIPAFIEDMPVTSVGLNAFLGARVSRITIPQSVSSIQDYAFQDCSSLTNILIQSSSTSVGEEAFSYCSSLTSIYFTGNPPDFGFDVFAGDDNATAYYLLGSIGWSTNSIDIPVLLWNPVIQTAAGGLGLSSNQFGFNITGTANIPIAVEVCTNLANPIWSAIQTLTLTNGLYYFSEIAQTNISGRYYRISSP